MILKVLKIKILKKGIKEDGLSILHMHIKKMVGL